MKSDTITQNCQQVITHPVPGGTWIIIRYGLIFRVMLDCPEGLVEFDQTWIQRNKSVLFKISLIASQKIHQAGLEVNSYKRP